MQNIDTPFKKRNRVDEFQLPSEVMTSPSKEAPIRISKSCDACRTKKLKCNSQKVCAYCKKNNLNCVYSTVRKPGLKPGYGKDVTRRLSNLEEDNQRILEELKLLHAKFFELKKQNAGSHRTNVSIVSVPNLLNKQESITPIESNIPSVNSSNILNQESEFMENTQSRLSSDNCSFGLELPSIDQVNVIVENFFSKVFPSFPIIHPLLTRRNINGYISQLHSLDADIKSQTEPPLIVYGIILTTIRFLSSNKVPNLSSEQMEKLHTTCKEKIILKCYSVSNIQQLQTMTLLAYDTFSRSNGTESWALISLAVSGAIHLNLSDIHQNVRASPPSAVSEHSPASVASESSTSGSRDSNKRAKTVNTKSASLLQKPKTYVEEESRKRLLWGILILDSLSAVISGLPRKMPNLASHFLPPIKTDLWINYKDHEDSSSILETSNKSDLQFFDAFSYYVEISTIFGEIHSFIRNPLDIENKVDVGNWFIEFHRLENKVYSWKDEIAEQFQELLDTNEIQRNDMTPMYALVNGVSLHALYNVTLIKLNSAYGYPHAESSAFEHSRHSRRVCHSCVENVSKMASLLFELEEAPHYGTIFEFLGPHYAFYIWVCCRLLIADFIFNLKDGVAIERETIDKHLRLFAEILKRVGKYWLVSKKYNNILKRLITLDIEFNYGGESSGEEKEDQEKILPSSALADMRINTHLLSLILTRKTSNISNGDNDDGMKLSTQQSFADIDLQIKNQIQNQEDHQLIEAFQLDTTSYGFEDFFKYLDDNNFSSY